MSRIVANMTKNNGLKPNAKKHGAAKSNTRALENIVKVQNECKFGAIVKLPSKRDLCDSDH